MVKAHEMKSATRSSPRFNRTAPAPNPKIPVVDESESDEIEVALPTNSVRSKVNIKPETPSKKKGARPSEIDEKINLEEISPSKTPKSSASGKKRKRVGGDTENTVTNGSPLKNKVREEDILVDAKVKSEPADLPQSSTEVAKPSRSHKKAKVEPSTESEEERKAKSTKPKPKVKRKTKEEKEAEKMPLAARTSALKVFIGAHVSCAKGVQNSVTNSVHIGGNAFAMFLKSQRKWENPPLQEEHRDQFKSQCTHHKYDSFQHVLPHGSYLVNLAQAEPDKAAQAYSGFIDDLHRCESLGIKFYNFHPGSTGSHPRPAAISRIAKALNKAHKETQTVVPVLETMATRGSNIIGSTFEDLRDIINEVEDKDRIGVCLDTCHVFAAGYDLREPKAFKTTLEQFDDIIGMRYLKALHLNDSKAPLGAGRDLHQNIGQGFLGLLAFHNVVNEPRFEGLPLILETPIDKKDENGKDVEDKGVWAREIKMLESMIGMDAESEEFKQLEASLSSKSVEEKEKYEEAFERKKEKISKTQGKLKFRGKAAQNVETDSEDGR